MLNRGSLSNTNNNNVNNNNNNLYGVYRKYRVIKYIIKIKNNKNIFGWALSSLNHAVNFDFILMIVFFKKRPVWEVIEGYRDPNMRVQKPANYEGILLKRRNWPMKGWHKRYFILADGILTYGKSKADVSYFLFFLFLWIFYWGQFFNWFLINKSSRFLVLAGVY